MALPPLTRTASTVYATTADGQARAPDNGEVLTYQVEIEQRQAALDAGKADASALTAETDARIAGDDAANLRIDDVEAIALSGVRKPKAPVRLLMTTNVVIASALENGDTLDGETLVTGDRVALTGQSTAAQNGVYVVVASGAASRSADMDSESDLIGSRFLVEDGTHANEVWALETVGEITVGTTDLTFILTENNNATTAEVADARQGEASLSDNLTAMKAATTAVADEVDDALTNASSEVFTTLKGRLDVEALPLGALALWAAAIALPLGWSPAPAIAAPEGTQWIERNALGSAIDAAFGDGIAGAAYVFTRPHFGGRATLFQDDLGLEPVTALGQPVKLALNTRAAFNARGNVLTRPSGFPYAPPFTITKTGPQTYITDFDPDDYQIVSSVTYYLSPTGNDANDGLSASAPKKSIRTLINALNSAPPPGGATLILAPGNYIGTDSINGGQFQFDANLICPAGRARLYSQQTPSWSATVGRTNVHETTADAATNGVVDLTDLDSYGIEIRLREAADLDACEATAGTYFYTGTTLYVHLHDNRAPDADIIVFTPTGIVWDQNQGQNVFCRNVDFWGRLRPVDINHSGAGRYVFDNCSLRYACASSSGNGLETNLSSTDALTIIYGGDASYNRLDGYNYDGSHRYIEIGAKGVWNGYIGTNTADNGSTAHGNVVGIRVNGIYRYNDDKNIHDINTTYNWLVGCVAGDALNSAVDPYDNVAFLAGGASGSDNTRTWLEGCTSSGGVVTDVGAFSNAIVQVLDCVDFNNPATGDAGSIITDKIALWSDGAHISFTDATWDVSPDTGVPGVLFNGTSSFGVSAPLDLTGSDEVTVFAGVYRDTTANMVVAETDIQVTTGQGKFALLCNGSAGDRPFFFRSRGSSTSDAFTTNATYAPPRSDNVTAIGKISTDVNIIRARGTQLQSVATNQGSGNFGNYNLYIGARAGASLFLDGHMTALVVAGDVVGDTARDALEAEMAVALGI